MTASTETPEAREVMRAGYIETATTLINEATRREVHGEAMAAAALYGAAAANWKAAAELADDELKAALEEQADRYDGYAKRFAEAIRAYQVKVVNFDAGLSEWRTVTGRTPGQAMSNAVKEAKADHGIQLGWVVEGEPEVIA